MTKKLYIRFNNLPKDNKSLIYNEDGLIIGKRAGVSVFNCRQEGTAFYPALPMPCTPAALEEFAKYTMYDDGQEHPMYLVLGEEIDRDNMNNPIIINPLIIATLDADAIFPDRKTSLN